MKNYLLEMLCECFLCFKVLVFASRVVLVFLIARGLLLFLGFNPITGEPYPNAKVGDHFMNVIKFIQTLKYFTFCFLFYTFLLIMLNNYFNVTCC